MTAKVEGQNGRITVYTTNGGYYGAEKLLSYRDMSFLTVMVDGKYYSNNDQAQFDPATFGGDLNRGGVTTKIADTVRTTWKIATGEIIQDVYPVAFDFSGQIVMRWKYHCITYDISVAQLQYLLDTYVVTNDRARVLTRYGYFDQWTLYIPNNTNYNPIPPFYQAFQFALKNQNFNPGVVSQGTFISPDMGLMVPDAVVVGDWNILSLIPWGWPATFPVDSYDDSAILMRFALQAAQAGQTVELGSTSYGTGEFETCIGPLYALIFRPRHLKPDATGTAYTPNPFPVDMYLFNTDQYTQANSAQATLTVGNHLTIIDSGAQNNGKTLTQLTTPRTIPVGGVSTITWHVLAEKTCDQDTSFLTFTSQANIANPGFLDTCKLPVSFPCLDKDTLPPLADPVVSNGFTKSVAFQDNRPKDRGIDKIMTSGYDPQYFSVTIDPFSPCTKQKVWVNIRQLDSTVGGCVTVQALDCAGNQTTVDVCFPKYPLHPDTIPPRVVLIHADTTYDGSFCNMKYDTLLGVDDTTFDKGLKSISITPQTTPVNMALNVNPFPVGAARQGFAIHVLDSLVNGSISVRVTDAAGNFTDYPLSYCTIADTNPPITSVVQTGPFEWSVFVQDEKPYDRRIDTISVHNRNNVRLVKNSAVFEPTRQLTRGQPTFVFKVQVVDTLQPASFCVRAKDLADSTTPDIDKAHWWSSDTCLDRQPGKDVWAPNIAVSPSPLLNSTTDTIKIDDIHYFQPSFLIGWDKGIDSVWFDNVDGFIVPPTIHAGCTKTVPPFVVKVADSTAIKKISTVCIHVVDCAGNRNDTCLYYPVKPDDIAPYIIGQQPSRAEIDLHITDSTRYDRGLQEIHLENAVNFDPFQKTVTGSKYEVAPLFVTRTGKSATGTLVATDLWGSVYGLKDSSHTSSVNVAIYTQDLKMKVAGVAQQNSDAVASVYFVANDTFSLASKGIHQFSFAFDLVGDPNFTYAGTDVTGTAASGWTVTGSQSGNRVTVSGYSTDGSVLTRQDIPLLKVLIHSSSDASTRQVTLVPVAINNASVSYNWDRDTLVTNGTHALAWLPAPYGSMSGVTIVAQGYCSPTVVAGGQVTIAALDNITPNPFSNKTEISYAVPQSGYTRLIIYDALGREVTRLVNSVVEAGYHTVVFNAVGLPGGVYYARLDAAGQVITRKLDLAK